MLDVHDRQSLPEFREVPNDGIGIGLFLPRASAPLGHALPEQLCLANQGGLTGSGIEPSINRRDGDSKIDLAVYEGRPIVTGLGVQNRLG